MMPYTLDFTKPMHFFKSLPSKMLKVQSYLKDWDSITPKSDEDHYERFVLASLSVNIHWRQTVRGFEVIQELFNDCEGYLPGPASTQPTVKDDLWCALQQGGV